MCSISRNIKIEFLLKLQSIKTVVELLININLFLKHIISLCNMSGTIRLKLDSPIQAKTECDEYHSLSLLSDDEHMNQGLVFYFVDMNFYLLTKWKRSTVLL